jgi:lysophospholipase L1-like esterase
MAFLPQPARAQLQAGDRVAVIGDSITEQKMYSVFIADYLVACQPVPKLRPAQFGWGGETIWGLKDRLSASVLWFHPTVVTTCYGMNDGGYVPFKPETGDKYRGNTEQVIDHLKSAGVRFIVIGAPGAVDTDTFKSFTGTKAAAYNDTLAHLAEIDKQVAAEKGCTFADTHGIMADVMAKVKAKYPGTPLAGNDGIHPGDNGHFVMAYAFLKALGCDGNIGTITVDAAANKAEATDGHRIVSFKSGVLDVESTRLPFTVAGDANDPKTARAMLQFIPFNQELNRFQLVVKNAKPGKWKVTWGDASKEFDAAALAAGINLAAEFPDNPTASAFNAIHHAVKAQQDFETPLTKDLMMHVGPYKQMLPDQAEAVDALAAAGVKRDESLYNDVAATVKPVRYTIRIEAVNP